MGEFLCGPWDAQGEESRTLCNENREVKGTQGSVSISHGQARCPECPQQTRLPGAQSDKEVLPKALLPFQMRFNRQNEEVSRLREGCGECQGKFLSSQ